MMDTEKNLLNLELFQSWQSRKLRIHFTPDDIQEAMIVEVKPLTASDNSRTSFSLILHTEMKEHYYNQSTYLVELPDGRDEMIFMVPIGVDPGTGGIRYEVIFN